jgi:hypothetical protein
MGHADWHDMSEYVVHLTDRAAVESVFRSNTIEARTRTGTVRNLSGIGDAQLSVCLSEIPIGHLDRLTRRGFYGIGFLKKFVEAQDGQMVTYLPKGSPAAARFQQLVQSAMTDRVQPGNRINPDNPLWSITQFVDNPGPYGDTRYEFEWEREWRVPRHLVFGGNDVALLLAPEEDHDWMRQTAWFGFAPSRYQGLVLDPRWDIHRVQHELANSDGGPA